MRRYVIAALLGPVALWAGLVVIGRKRADNAGTTVFSDRGEFLAFPHGLLVESMAAGALAAYLVK